MTPEERRVRYTRIGWDDLYELPECVGAVWEETETWCDLVTFPLWVLMIWWPWRAQYTSGLTWEDIRSHLREVGAGAGYHW